MVAPLQYDGRIYSFIDKLYKGDGVLENPEYLNGYLARANQDSIKRISMCSFKEGKIFALNPSTGALDLTFTRNDANKTRINSEGEVENACYNLLSNSKTLSDFTPYWNTTIYDFNQAAPNEEVGAMQIEKDYAASGPVGFSKTVTLEKNKYYNYSCYFKHINSPEVYIKVQVGALTAYLKFNIETGAFLEQANIENYTIQPLKDGWYRIDMGFLNNSADTAGTIFVEMIGYSDTSQWLKVWGPQVSLGKTVKPYLATTTRDHVPSIDYSAGQPALLLEPQRSNYFWNSDNFQTQSKGLSLGRWTVSFYGTGSITMSGAYTGVLNGSGTNTRVTLNFELSTGGTVLFTSSGQVLKAQLEFGYYPTSYIQTPGNGGVNRLQDSISVIDLYTKGITSSAGGVWYMHLINNSSFYNTTSSGSILYMGTTPSEVLFGITSSTGLGRLKILCYGQEYDTSTDTIKVAFKWDNILLKTFLNGVLLDERPFTPINLQRLTSGTMTSPLRIADMWLSPTALTDSQLITLTTL